MAALLSSWQVVEGLKDNYPEQGFEAASAKFLNQYLAARRAFCNSRGHYPWAISHRAVELACEARYQSAAQSPSTASTQGGPKSQQRAKQEGTKLRKRAKTKKKKKKKREENSLEALLKQEGNPQALRVDTTYLTTGLNLARSELTDLATALGVGLEFASAPAVPASTLVAPAVLATGTPTTASTPTSTAGLAGLATGTPSESTDAPLPETQVVGESRPTEEGTHLPLDHLAQESQDASGADGTTSARKQLEAEDAKEAAREEAWKAHVETRTKAREAESAVEQLVFDAMQKTLKAVKGHANRKNVTARLQEAKDLINEAEEILAKVRCDYAKEDELGRAFVLWAYENSFGHVLEKKPWHINARTAVGGQVQVPAAIATFLEKGGSKNAERLSTAFKTLCQATAAHEARKQRAEVDSRSEDNESCSEALRAVSSAVDAIWLRQGDATPEIEAALGHRDNLDGKIVGALEAAQSALSQTSEMEKQKKIKAREERKRKADEEADEIDEFYQRSKSKESKTAKEFEPDEATPTKRPRTKRQRPTKQRDRSWSALMNPKPPTEEAWRTALMAFFGPHGAIRRELGPDTPREVEARLIRRAVLTLAERKGVDTDQRVYLNESACHRAIRIVIELSSELAQSEEFREAVQKAAAGARQAAGVLPPHQTHGVPFQATMAQRDFATKARLHYDYYWRLCRRVDRLKRKLEKEAI